MMFVVRLKLGTNRMVCQDTKVNLLPIIFFLFVYFYIVKDVIKII